MQNLMVFFVLGLAYIIGSVPFGLLIVRLATGKDIRLIESGRTGGTNAMRAAGFWAGLSTALLDILKSASTVWLVRLLETIGFLPQTAWLEILAPLFAVIGHNYSIFLAERDENGKLHLRGGAGGAPATGGAFGLWAPSLLITVPLGALILFGIGYASVATLSMAFIATILFAYRAWIGASPWQYCVYGLVAIIILMWALRPNLRRLFKGTERLVGIRAWLKKKMQANQSVNPNQ